MHFAWDSRAFSKARRLASLKRAVMSSMRASTEVKMVRRESLILKKYEMRRTCG